MRERPDKSDFFEEEKIKYRVFEGKKGIERTYDEMADVYDDSPYLFWTRKIEKCEENVIQEWIETFSPPVLDIGSGTGRYSIKLAEMGLSVVSCDISIAIARARHDLLRELWYRNTSPRPVF